MSDLFSAFPYYCHQRLRKIVVETSDEWIHNFLKKNFFLNIFFSPAKRLDQPTLILKPP
jgi:hypothetical protein